MRENIIGHFLILGANEKSFDIVLYKLKLKPAGDCKSQNVNYPQLTQNRHLIGNDQCV